MQALMELNIALFYIINQLAVSFPLLAPVAVLLAEYTVLVLPVVFIIYGLSGRRDKRLMLISSILAFFLAVIVGRLLGLLHDNEQPFYVLKGANQLIEHAIDNSFPSDHTMLFFSVCVSFFLYKAAWRYAWLLLAVLVGLSRIVVGVHYPFDVFVGACLGVVASLVFYLWLPRSRLIAQLLDFYEAIELRVLQTLGFKQRS